MRDALDIDALSRQYGAMVLRRCRRLLSDEDEALDACQDVFVRLIEHRDRVLTCELRAEDWEALAGAPAPGGDPRPLNP